VIPALRGRPRPRGGNARGGGRPSPAAGRPTGAYHVPVETAGGRGPAAKVVPLAAAAALVADGDHITVGGVMLHRIPAAFVRELARQGRRGLRLSKPSPSYDLDLLSAAGCLAEVDAGVASLESAFGGALPNYRRAVEAGLLRVREFS
jgi:glutaconate CoA-transferase subunit A